MQNDENLDFEQVQQNEEVEADTQEVEANTNQEEGSNDSTDWKSEAAKWKAIATRNKSKTKPEVQQEKKGNQNISRDEIVLLTKGYEEKDIEYLTIISKGKGISLQEATKDEVFVAYREKQEAERRSAKSKLGASNGSGYSKPESSFRKPMTAEEHKAAFMKAMGR